ncbi:hypothetical protein BSKO_06060 [Bryopsis sp. KO-2023]|nr:hypothetical protein BSKO_06060 [Bryopsis sp. KO-2023]
MCAMTKFREAVLIGKPNRRAVDAIIPWTFDISWTGAQDLSFSFFVWGSKKRSKMSLATARLVTISTWSPRTCRHSSRDNPPKRPQPASQAERFATN